MPTNRTLILIVFIVLSGFAISWLIDVSERTALPEQVSRNDPDVYMIGAKVTQFTREGHIKHEIHAEKMTHFPLTDVTTLKVPNLLLYSAESQAPWDIIASDGRVLPQARLREEIVELWHQVLATREKSSGDFIYIQTESLTVYPDRDYVETIDPVLIDNSSGRTEAGGGMKAYLDTGRFEFFSKRDARVRTVIAPKAPRADAG